MMRPLCCTIGAGRGCAISLAAIWPLGASESVSVCGWMSLFFYLCVCMGVCLCISMCVRVCVSMCLCVACIVVHCRVWVQGLLSSSFPVLLLVVLALPSASCCSRRWVCLAFWGASPWASEWVLAHGGWPGPLCRV